MKNRAIVVLIISLSLLLGFILVVTLKSLMGDNSIRYPDFINCKYKYEFDFANNTSRFRELAEVDKKSTLSSPPHGLGNYMCYCKMFGQTSADDDFCIDYYAPYYRGLVINNSITILITVLNIVLRLISIKLIQAAGYSTTMSKQSRSIMFVCTASSFINNGLVLLLSNANLDYAPFPLNKFQVLSKKQYVDFDSSWYSEIGVQITQTMLIQAFFPWLEFCFWYSLKTVKRLKDSSCCMKKTKCTT